MRITSGNKTIVYTADGSYSEDIVKFSRDADLLMCECNFYAEQSGSSAGHMNSTDAARTAKNADVKKLLLTHLPQYGDLNELLRDAEKTFKGEIELAGTGWTWEG
jgi:ribonuclease BN (tRNA processing enzyme)